MARKRMQARAQSSSAIDGRWCAQLHLGWQGGKQQRKYIYGTTAHYRQGCGVRAAGRNAQQRRGNGNLLRKS